MANKNNKAKNESEKSTEEQLLDLFLAALKVENRNYREIIDEDKKFCKFLYDNFSTAKKLATNENILSFYLIEELNDFVYNKIHINNDFYIDGYSNKLSTNYYEVLKEYIFNQHNKANIDKIVWIKSILRYIDNMCQTLSFTRDKAFKDSNDSVLNYTNQIEIFSHQIVSLNNDLEVITNKYNENNEMYENLREEFIEAKHEIEESKRKATETTIAVLSVFSAIVLAFNGSTLFASSTLEAIGSTSIYRLLIIVFSLGIVFINIIYALFNFIGNLIERNSLIKESENKKKSAKFVSIKHLVAINSITIVIIISIILCWNFGVVEQRNKQYNDSTTTQISQTYNKEKATTVLTTQNKKIINSNRNSAAFSFFFNCKTYANLFISTLTLITLCGIIKV